MGLKPACKYQLICLLNNLIKMNPNFFSKNNLLMALLAVFFCAVLPDTSFAQPLTVTTIAGQFEYSTYKDGLGTNALFGEAGAITADSSGNLYVVDIDAIRKISPNFTVSTLAGLESYGGYLDSTNTSLFQDPFGIAVDKNGYVYVADWGNCVVRKISPAGVVTTLAGDGTSGYIDATGTNAEFSNLHGIAVDSSGTVYVTDVYEGTYSYQERAMIRKITPDGTVSTLAGGTPGTGDGVGTDAHFDYPQGLAVDSGGTVYVADSFGIRKVAPDGTVTTWVGSASNNGLELDGIGASAGFEEACDIALDRSGGAYVADQDGRTIRYVSSAGVVSTVAGLADQSPTNRFNDGVGSGARFVSPYGIAVDASGNVFITDAYADTILKATPPSLSPIGSFSESPGVTPVRSNNPWQFTAYYTNIVSDLRLRVQSTTTTNIESSWTDLPGNPYMTDVGGNWTLNNTDVPAGTRYFRVIASAPGYFDSASAPAGPENVLDGIGPFGYPGFPTSASAIPFQAGNLWVFNITESSLAAGLNLRLQSSGDGGNTWSDLPGGQMTRYGSTWALNATNVPIGEISFRVVASATNYTDRISAASPTFDIEGQLPVITENNSTPGRKLLSLDDDPATQDPAVLLINSISIANSNASTYCTIGEEAKYKAAIALAGTIYLSTAVMVGPGQTLTTPAVNIGSGGAEYLQGTNNGDVQAQQNGALGQNEVTVNLVGNDGSSLIGQDGSGLIGQDGSGLIGQDGSGLIGQDGSGLTSDFATKVKTTPVLNAKTNGPVRPSDLPQPTFTGQMTINGNYYQSGGVLMIGIAGTNTLDDGAQQFDQLVVSGTANLNGGGIAFEFFDPNDQTDRTNVFQPPDGATFDVLVASNIVASAVHIRGPVWGDGLFFKGSVVTRDDGLQAVRLTATYTPPQIFLQNAGSALRLVFGTNYTGYTIQSATSLSLSNWTAFATGTNVVMVGVTNSSRFFRLSKP